MALPRPAERDDYPGAEFHARLALRWYPKHHPRFPFFAADVAYLLILQHMTAPAVALLETFAAKPLNPPDRVLGVSLLARGLAAIGRTTDYESVRATVEALIAEYPERAASARVNLAEGERALGRWSEGEAHARAAVQAAEEPGSAELLRIARNVFSMIEARLAPPREVELSRRQLSEMLNALSGRLANWSTTRRGRSRTLSLAEWAA